MSKIPPKIQSLGSTQAKETLYIDVDDEITAVIDKVTASKAKVIALVLPKRATVMQSTVNMKLLKRSAEEAGKNIVLITSESSLMPLAGLIGMHVAATPTSKPSVPKAPDAASDEPESVDEPLDIVDGTAGPEPDFDAAAAAATPVGALAAKEPESILMPEDDADEDAEEAIPAAAPVAKPDKKLKVPSFNKFKWGIVAAIAAVILIITGWIFAAVVLPKASVAITTDTSTVTSDLNLTLDTAAKGLDADNKIIPAQSQSTSKTYTQDAPATGQQNNGMKASGSVVFSATQCAPNINTTPDPIATGSSTTSSGHTYITQEKATYAFVKLTSGSCALYKTNSTAITALKGGSEYNLSDGSNFSGAGIGTGSATGGTDDIVKVLSQADIDAATQKINSQDTSAIATTLTNALKAKGLLAVTSTLLAGDQQITTSAKAGDKVENVTVTAVTPYTMLGIQQSDLRKLVLANVDSQIDTKKQKILDDGIAKAKFTQQNPGSATNAVVAVKVRTTAGPELNPTNLKQQVAGLKEGDIKELINSTPGVTDVQVSYSPGWVSKAPKNVQKITIIIDGVVN